MTVLGIRHVVGDAGLEEKSIVSTLFLMTIVVILAGIASKDTIHKLVFGVEQMWELGR
jgi:hypothetical protein